MKRFLLVALAAALGIGAVSCRDGSDSKTKDGGEFNFRKTTWGMSREQVKASEDTEPTGDRPEVVTYRGEFEGIPVIIGYVFDGDKLARAGYLMRGSYQDPNSYISDYDKVKESLIKSYGSPAEDNVVWDEGEEVQDPALFGESVCAGKLVYSTMWSDGVTVIRENLSGEDGKCSHGVTFESVELFIKKTIQDSESSQSPPNE
ncbi:MAG: hypothetical protein AB1598_05135 [Thermodesulfobacteriota bacterium]